MKEFSLIITVFSLIKTYTFRFRRIVNFYSYFKGLALVLMTISVVILLVWEFLMKKQNLKLVLNIYEKIQNKLNKKIFRKRVKVCDLIKW